MMFQRICDVSKHSLHFAKDKANCLYWSLGIAIKGRSAITSKTPKKCLRVLRYTWWLCHKQEYKKLFEKRKEEISLTFFFSNKNGCIWDHKKITLWDLQPWWASPLQQGGENYHIKRKKIWEHYREQSVHDILTKAMSLLKKSCYTKIICWIL